MLFWILDRKIEKKQAKVNLRKNKNSKKKKKETCSSKLKEKACSKAMIIKIRKLIKI